jgi:2-polyprenyl-3-methyl-5-hydroxy-6-metoxy-1,4-benzoquinol methylase
MVKLLLGLAVAPLLLMGQSAPATDDEIWKHFVEWTAALPALPAGQHVAIRDRYVEGLRKAGVEEKEAARRFERMLQLRRATSERERVYWDASFKSGGGPDDALMLLQDAVRKLKPGRALDAGMGRGRNAIYLASLGWEATGYDMSAEALKVAEAYAAKAGVRIKTVEAKHDTFEFGEGQWDLIVCAYCYMRPDEAQWPEVFWKALKPGGVVVFQTSVSERIPVGRLAELWKKFRLLRAEDLDAGVVDNDWTPSRTFPTAKLVARKE